MSKSNCDPHKRFAAALLLRAAKDASNTRSTQAERAEALCWLTESVDAADFLDGLDIAHDVARTWARGTLWQEKTL